MYYFVPGNALYFHGLCLNGKLTVSAGRVNTNTERGGEGSPTMPEVTSRAAEVTESLASLIESFLSPVAFVFQQNWPV